MGIKIDLQNGKITEIELQKIIEDFMSTEEPVYREQELYYFGQNPNILHRSIAANTKDAPDNRVPISYGRKIVKTVSGYIARPGYITYTYENDQDKEYYNEVYRNNGEPILTNEIATYQSVNGFCFELHYIDSKGEGTAQNHKMTLLKAYEGIPVFNYDIDPKMVAFIRLYKKEKSQYAEVYYADSIDTYKRDETTKKYKLESSIINMFGEIPVVIYQNNDEKIGELTTSVKKLIDANDILYSDSLNEFDRFAWAYLLMSGQSIDEEDAKNIKNKRIFENLESTDAVKFLTKDINTDFIKFMEEWTRTEIHKQSGIPDIENIKVGSGATGIAISKFLWLMEYAIVDKDAFLRKGIKQRDYLLGVIRGSQPEAIKIDMKRNVPDNNLDNAEIYGKYHGRGISEETLMENFATFVENPAEEREKYLEEQRESIDVLEPQGIEEQGEEEPE